MSSLDDDEIQDKDSSIHFGEQADSSAQSTHTDIPNVSSEMYKPPEDSNLNTPYQKSSNIFASSTPISNTGNLQQENLHGNSSVTGPDKPMDNSSRCSHHENKPSTSTASVGEGPNLCKNCSRSMLSYITLIQRFLDRVAQDVSGQMASPIQCVECDKEGLQFPELAWSHDHRSYSKRKLTKESIHNTSPTEKTTETRSNTEDFIPLKPSSENTRKTLISDFISSGEDLENQSSTVQTNITNQNEKNSFQTISGDSTIHNNKFPLGGKYSSTETDRSVCHQKSQVHSDSFQSTFRNETQEMNQNTNRTQSESFPKSTFSNPLRTPSKEPEDSLNSISQSPTSFSINFCVDGILTALYKVERELKDLSKGSSVWECLSSLQNGNFLPPSPRITDEAFVTLARTNSDVFGCLVLGASLLLSGTSRTICVLLSDSVDSAFVAPLSSVFHEVQHVRSLDSLGTTKLSLLDQPALGITFEKLNVWRLKQFKKCIFLGPDTLVVQNCDELFCREELSAVPDIGWPDCFNSAVFVFEPSNETFWNLVEFAEKQRSYDGGDQGLLNSYFNTWSQDIHKKLSFIYNLMANVSYTYTPAFKQFGRGVKIVQFMGPYKPWHVKFYSESGQISPTSSVHPIYVQFVHVWLNVFRVVVLPLFSPEIQAYSSSQNILSPVDLLSFFPTKMNSEFDFLTPPSVRLHPADSSQFTSSPVVQKLQLPQKNYSSDDPLLIPPLTPDDSLFVPSMNLKSENEIIDEYIGISVDTDENQLFCEGSVNDEATKVTEESEMKVENVEDCSKDGLPGSKIGDFQGMAAWEQGRMDYTGSANSDLILQRLRFLIQNPERNN